MSSQNLNFNTLGQNEKGIYGTGLGLAVTRWMLKNDLNVLIPEYSGGKISVHNAENGTFALDNDKLYYADSQHSFPSEDYCINGTPQWETDTKLWIDYVNETMDPANPLQRIQKEIFIEFKTGLNAATERNQQMVMEALSRNMPVENLPGRYFFVLLCHILPDKKMKQFHVIFSRFSDTTGWKEIRRYEYSDFSNSNSALDSF